MAHIPSSIETWMELAYTIGELGYEFARSFFSEKNHKTSKKSKPVERVPFSGRDHRISVFPVNYCPPLTSADPMILVATEAVVVGRLDPIATDQEQRTRLEIQLEEHRRLAREADMLRSLEEAAHPRPKDNWMKNVQKGKGFGGIYKKK